ncbi:hypothetical protein PGTUg99_002198 [Puccinia graminis f. sp. tritici]|uniref:Uncharacterized protein n=1 Tax=Puccinia graminis f. sp. tritici TaxID=56615 RepID=A0A5B0PT85_PUCGR|nr:hypothetical protein PGTUg99_002198 [Puccinia graminis f. sp. tritici]
MTNVTIFLIITCGILIPSHKATFPKDSNTTSRSHEVAKRLESPHQPAGNESTSLSPVKQSGYNPPSNSTPATNQSLPGSSDLNGGLLTDPSHPDFGPVPVGVPIAKPSDLVTSALLTAAPSAATAKSNSSSASDGSKNKQNQGYNNTLGQQPVLSGSMAISLPTPSTTSMPSLATQPPVAANGAVSLSSIAPNTVLEVYTAAAGGSSPTPTTSTAYVYATNSPISSDNASTTPNSSSHNLLPSSMYLLVGLACALILVISN